MGKLRRLSGKEVCDILSRHGFAQTRVRGSHAIMQRHTEGVTVTVPVPLHETLAIGTLAAIIRQSRVPRSEFEA